jgi:hypothetical protein
MTLLAGSMQAQPFFFSTGNPDGKMGSASRPDSTGKIEIESADDFVLTQNVHINSATFTGILTGATPVIGQVRVEIYRVFPLDSVNPPSGNVPTRVNSPSDVEFDDRDTASANLTFTTSVLSASFSALNSVLNGINKIPAQTTGGEGPITGQEVVFDANFTPSIDLPPGHYFFIPQVTVTGGEFYWLSAPKPIIAPGTPFAPDLQTWIRNADLDPDWLRIGTDVVGGATPPTFNAAFSLTGTIFCPDHTVHGHITTTAPDPHDLDSHLHHGQHGHLIAPGTECLPAGHHLTFDGHILGLTAGETASAVPSALSAAREPNFVSILNETGAAEPAARGTVIALFGSAAGLFLDGPDERPAIGIRPAAGMPRFFTTVVPEVQIGGIPAEVLFSGLAPGLKGVWQLVVRVPGETAPGQNPVSISYDGRALLSVDVQIQ